MIFSTTIDMIGTILFGLIAAFGFVLWTIGTVRAFIRDRRHTLRRGHVTNLIPIAIATIMSTTLTASIYNSKATEQNLSYAPTTSLIIKSVGILLAACGLLWLAFLYLRLRPKVPHYLYLLPGDAERVRFAQCKHGIAFAASCYPKIVTDRDLLSTFARAIAISCWIEVFSRGKKDDVQLTNEFSMYCMLAIDGFQRGYDEFLAKCVAAPDNLASLRAMLAAWPENEHSYRTMNTLAGQILGQDRTRAG